MTFTKLILRNTLRRKARTIFTVGSVIVAFVLFGVLLPIDRMFQSRIEFANTNRLIVTNKASIMRPLPVSYGERLARVENVKLVAHFTFFGAFYRDPSNQVAAIVTQPERFAAMVDEVEFRDQAQLQRWLEDPTGIAVGRQLADRYGWKVGDLVPVYSTIYQREDGSQAWTFRVATIFDGAGEDADTNSMVIDYRHFDAARAVGKGTVGWYAIRIDDPSQAAATAERLDALFRNSPDETSAVTEKAFAQSFLRQVGNFGVMLKAALALVFWTLALVTANTMAQSIRERFSEIAVLKTLGFDSRRIFGIVVGESLLIMVSGGLIGLVLAAIAVPLVAQSTEQLLSTLTVSWSDWILGVGLMAALGALVALLPATRAARQQIVTGLSEAA
jgi:putative ABC transport system permease protein